MPNKVSGFRRGPLALLLLLCCHAGAASALTADEVRHVSERLGFGATPAEVRALSGLSREQAVDFYLDAARGPCAENAATPAWAGEEWPSKPEHSERARAARKHLRHVRIVEMQYWWLENMVRSACPFNERMALFWHGYFPIITLHVTETAHVLRQTRQFRDEWGGNYRTLLKTMSRDQGMLESLKLVSSDKKHPNENYAREFLELYTLGPGNYTEQDIREASRAFSGLKIWRRNGWVYQWWPAHDFGSKTFLGQTGRWNGDDIVDIVLQQPRAAVYFVERLWREFISPLPDAAAVERLSAGFRTDYEVRPLLRKLLLSDDFWSPANRSTLTKSPVDLAVGTLRTTGAKVDTHALAAWTAAMGQALYLPPDVKGWRGQDRWISVQSLQDRRMFLRGIADGFEDDDIAALVTQVPEYPGFDEQSLTGQSRLLHQGLLDANVAAALHPLQDNMAYQVK